MRSDAEVRSQVCEVLERFNDLVSTQNLQVLAEFAPGDEVLLVGSDAGEVATGSQELEAFFARIFARDTTFSWEWDRIDVSHAGDLAWFFADGRVVLSTAKEQRRTPYRITGVLERHGERWLWRQYHGSEPVTSE
jgi:ketosteroid isomerase-like protein